jgi:hypothetical protein
MRSRAHGLISNKFLSICWNLFIVSKFDARCYAISMITAQFVVCWEAGDRLTRIFASSKYVATWKMSSNHLLTQTHITQANMNVCKHIFYSRYIYISEEYYESEEVFFLNGQNIYWWGTNIVQRHFSGSLNRDTTFVCHVMHDAIDISLKRLFSFRSTLSALLLL